jgi:anthranilate phosphoribosyltransferase
MLGPLTNPAGTNAQIIGVYDKALVEKITPVLKNLGIEHGLVFHGMDGIDEISTIGETFVGEVTDGRVQYYYLTPDEFDIPLTTVNEIRMKDPAKSAETFRAVLNGKTGSRRDAVLLNAGAALYVSGKADSIKKGIELARDSIDSGAALQKLNEFIKATNRG